MNIDSLGEGKIELLFDKSLLRSIGDLYNLSYEQLFGLEKVIEQEDGSIRRLSFKDKTVQNILKGIEESKQVPFGRVLFAMGIRYVGVTTAQKLANYFGNMTKLMKASYEELLEVDEVGEKIAQSIIHHFSNPDHQYEVGRLELAGLQMEQIEEEFEVTDNKLQGQSFVVSGVFSRSRDEIKKLIEEFGGKNVSAISGKTDFLLAGEKMGPAKKVKAEKLGVNIITEEQFYQMIELP